eukprot:1137869-Pelagomonas_calceolata.AAC.3
MFPGLAEALRAACSPFSSGKEVVILRGWGGPLFLRAPLGDLASLAGSNEGLDKGWSSRVHVGDTPMDIKAALAAGAKALGALKCLKEEAKIQQLT